MADRDSENTGKKTEQDANPLGAPEVVDPLRRFADMVKQPKAAEPIAPSPSPVDPSPAVVQVPTQAPVQTPIQAPATASAPMPRAPEPEPVSAPTQPADDFDFKSMDLENAFESQMASIVTPQQNHIEVPNEAPPELNVDSSQMAAFANGVSQEAANETAETTENSINEIDLMKGFEEELSQSFVQEPEMPAAPPAVAAPEKLDADIAMPMPDPVEEIHLKDQNDAGYGARPIETPPIEMPKVEPETPKFDPMAEFDLDDFKDMNVSESAPFAVAPSVNKTEPSNVVNTGNADAAAGSSEPKPSATSNSGWFKNLQSGLSSKSEPKADEPKIDDGNIAIPNKVVDDTALNLDENSGGSLEHNLDDEFEKLFAGELAENKELIISSDVSDAKTTPVKAPVDIQVPDPKIETDFGNKELNLDKSIFAHSDSASPNKTMTQNTSAASVAPTQSDRAIHVKVEEPKFGNNAPLLDDDNKDSDVSAVFADVPLSEPKRGGMKLGGVIVALALLGSVGALAWSYFGNTNKPTGDEQVAVIKASSEPTKVKPENPGGKVIANQESEVYQRVDGESKPNDQEVLANNREEPDQKVVEQAQDNNDFVQPRTVKTVVVKPDGTILTTEKPVNDATEVASKADAAEAAKIAADPETAPVPELTENGQEIIAGTDNPLVTDNLPKPDAKPAGVEGEVESLISTVETALGGEAPKGIKNPPLIKARPTQVAALAQPEKPAVVAPKPAAAAPKPAAVSGKTYVMQVAADRNAASAQTTYQRLLRRYNNLLAGRGVDIKKVTIEGKGVYHRIRIPVGTKQEAANLCSQYKSAGGQCFVTR